MSQLSGSLNLRHGASIGAIVVALLLPTAAFAQAAPPAPSQTDTSPPAPPSPADTAAPIAPVTTTGADAQADATGQDIIVTGFRQSLQAALDLKRNAVGSVDAIVAEDIGKFPDQNLAESMQRIPGVTITRDGGEGREISIRGLGSQFTVTRVNGLPAQAASMLAGSGGSNNRDRSFDFNIFASELFRSLVVHKTAEPSIDEGSLGGVVDLNTGHPLGAKTGLTGLASASASYNDLSKKAGPRLTGLLNWKSEDGTFGINGSLAYSHTKTDELGNNTTRWAQAAFQSVTTGGVTTPCFSGATYVHSAACDQATLAFHPRIPRYGIITHDRERLGATGAIEWQPSDRTHLEIDGLYSRYHEIRTEEWLEVLLRSNEKGIALVNPTYDGNNNLISGTFNNAYDRQEHYTQTQNDTFYQFSGTFTQNIGETFKINLLGGMSRSVEAVPIATTLMIDNKTAQGYSYDYTNMASPVLTYGTSVTNPANYQLAEIRDAPTRTVNTFKSGEVNAEWAANSEFTVKFGGVYRKFGFDTQGANRNTLVCPTNGKPDAVLGTFTCSATQYGFPVTSALVDTVNLGNAGQPAGTTSTFLVADLPAGAAFTNLYGRALVPDTSNTRSVSEEDKGGYLQFDVHSELLGLKYAFNGGVRYVETGQSSTGLQNGTTIVTVGRTYKDWLPSVNLALYPTSRINLRFAIAKVMTRPSLGNLTPGGSVDSFNFKVSYGNPQLDPYRATNFDAAFEWYFSRQSLLSVAFFHKDVASFPLASSIQGTYASTGLPLSILSPGSPAAQNPEAQPWTISTVVNGTGAKLTGVELGLQTPFHFLPGPLKNLGVILNATFIKSSANYQVQGPATTSAAITPTGTVTLVNENVRGTFFGLSNTTWNATLYYEKGGFSARASVNDRGQYPDQNSATGNIFEGFGSYISVDSAIRYSITRNVDLSVDATNLLDRYTYHLTDETTQRNYESYHVGRTIVAGARFKF